MIPLDSPRWAKLQGENGKFSEKVDAPVFSRSPLLASRWAELDAFHTYPWCSSLNHRLQALIPSGNKIQQGIAVQLPVPIDDIRNSKESLSRINIEKPFSPIPRGEI